MRVPRRLTETRWLQTAIGVTAAEYLRFVWKTSRFVIEPADIYERIDPDLPIILAMWHGQHFMMPFVRREHRAKVLVSRHRDGEVNAIAARRLGVGTVRGSGDHGRRFDRKGGVGAFKAMLTALGEGWNIALTADVPKVSRVAGRGIVKLGQASQRPIYPVAMATSRRIELNNWDRSAINLPFSRGAIVVAQPIHIPAYLGEAEFEAARLSVEAGLNAASARAYAIVDRQGASRE